jgi:hypothetical protein
MKRFLIALPLVVCAAAQAQFLMFHAELAGANERPNPVNSPATGFAMLLIDSSTGQWTLEGDYANLLTPVVASHIHGFADTNTNAGVLSVLTNTGGQTGSLSGSGTFTSTQIAQFSQNLGYVNVHSQQFAGGEIRGQLILVPGPGVAAGLALGGLVAIRRRR